MVVKQITLDLIWILLLFAVCELCFDLINNNGALGSAWLGQIDLLLMDGLSACRWLLLLVLDIQLAVLVELTHTLHD